MALVLKANSGSISGQTIALLPGLTFGRAGASVNLEDPKVSALHARLERSDDGHGWILLDLDSKNGLRDAAGARATRIELTAGVQFAIGITQFEVIAINEPTAAPPKKKKKKARYWHDVLASFLEKETTALTDGTGRLEPLSPSVILEFVRGVQVNSKWVLGFGPRKIGLASLDLPIWETDAPPLCFELHPSPGGVVFRTSHADVVLLNGKSVDNEVLRMGDTIQIFDTLIEVDFAE